MKRLILIVAVLVLFAGCSGVLMNQEYSQLLDETVVVSQNTAERALAGTFTEAEKTAALVDQAVTWRMFQDARDGVDK